MKFAKLSPDADMKKVIQCDDMDNDTLVVRLPDKIENKRPVMLKEGQYAILYKAGKVHDAIHKKGLYEIEASKQAKTRKEMEKWREFVPPKKDDSELCIIVFNMKEITQNNFYIDKPIEYIDWSKDKPIKARFTCKGKFNFKIEDPFLFFSRVFGVRDHYSKLELIEQIRKQAVSSIQEGINELSSEYKLSMELVKTKTSELEIKVNENEYDLKLKMRGIKITYFELTEIDIIADEKDVVEENKMLLKRLDTIIAKIKDNRKMIDKDNVKISINDDGEITYKSNIGICVKCGNLLEKDSKYCKICGAKN
jgi:membrane protease subunit (stomatin/prohibitin family)